MNKPFPFVISEPCSAGEMVLSESSRMMLGAHPEAASDWKVVVYHHIMAGRGDVKVIPLPEQTGSEVKAIPFTCKGIEIVSAAEWLRNITVDERFGLITYPFHLALENSDMDGDVFTLDISFRDGTVTFTISSAGVTGGTICHPYNPRSLRDVVISIPQS